MKNLEQIRALHAMKFWEKQRANADVGGENGGDVIRGLGSLIINNGLLATIAFATEKKKGYQSFMENIGGYLCSQGANGRNLWGEPTATLEGFLNKLTGSDSQMLQQATAETLAYISYLKRLRVNGNK